MWLGASEFGRLKVTLSMCSVYRRDSVLGNLLYRFGEARAAQALRKPDRFDGSVHAVTRFQVTVLPVEFQGQGPSLSSLEAQVADASLPSPTFQFSEQDCAVPLPLKIANNSHALQFCIYVRESLKPPIAISLGPLKPTRNSPPFRM